MELDLTAQLQPALWGLLIALVASASALVAAADREEVDLLWRHRHLRNAWRRRLHLVRTFRDRLIARVTALVTRMSQPLSRGRGKA